MKHKIEDLNHGIHCIDLVENGTIWRTSCYLVQEEKKVLVETGSSPSIPQILKGLEQVQVKPEEIDAIIVTHIHLDHAGAAGKLMELMPNATLIVHHRGAAHMINPEKLIEGAKAVYGTEQFDHYFSPILPVEESRVLVLDEGDEYDMGNGRKLHFYDSPGHARHHFFIMDSKSQGIFSGDTAGVFCREIYETHKIELCVPTTSPTQFDPPTLQKTLDRMLSLNPQRLYFTHFGMSEQPALMIGMLKEWLSGVWEDALQHCATDSSWQSISGVLREGMLKKLESLGIPSDSPTLQSLELDLEINAKGIISYAQRLARQAEKQKQAGKTQ